MLNISDAVKTKFLTDSTPKILTIDSEGVYYNRLAGTPVDVYPMTFHAGNLSPGGVEQLVVKSPTGVDSIEWQDSGAIDMSNTSEFSYISIEFKFRTGKWAGDESRVWPSNLQFVVKTHTKYSSDYSDRFTYSFNPEDCDAESDSDSIQIAMYFPTSELEDHIFIELRNPSSETEDFIGVIYITDFAVFCFDDLEDIPHKYTEHDPENANKLLPIYIDNYHLLSESFTLNESLCSEPNIKFGLCEAAYCQFTVTDNYHDFRDRVIKPKIRLVDSTGELAHTVLKQANLFGHEGESSTTNWPQPGTALTLTWNNTSLTNSKTVSNRLDISISESARTHLSEYQYIRVTFQVKITNFVASSVTPAKIIFYPRVSVDLNSGTTMGWTTFWSTDAQLSAQENCVALVTSLLAEYTTLSFDVPINYGDYYAALGDQDVIDYGVTTLHNLKDIAIRFIDADGNFYTDSTQTVTFSASYRNLQVNFIDPKSDVTPEYSTEDCVEFYGETLDDYVDRATGSIPLGVFTVNSIKKNYTNDILKQEITAYDKISTLEQNAADWYTQYMFGIDFTEYTGSNGFQFARQIFSTYYNFAKSTELDILTDRDYSEDLLWSETYTPGSGELSGTPKVTWRISDTTESGTDWNGNIYSGHKDSTINYVSHTINNPDVNKLYRVVLGVSDEKYGVLETIKERLPYYTEYFDSLFRGLDTANILVEQTRSNNSKDGICVNSGDYFMLAPDCTSITVYMPVCIQESRNYVNSGGWSDFYYSFVYYAQIFATVDSVAPDLSNGHTRLVYYNYGNKEIFACDSSITGRDVIHSLLEPNGCFYRLNRYTGIPEFIYCNKSGLYPRDDLYPADDLYPRLGTTDVINMSEYQSFIQEDYTVKPFGRIQILKNITSNETKSVVEWEYVGNSDFKNSYLIEDNIFYCNDKMEYDYDNMPEVSEMLSNMWMRISNMDYVPCVLKCKGMPWIECGDRIGVLTKTGGAETFIYHRTLTGIQSLIDTFESEGDEYNKEVKDYGYSEYSN